jgi:hypothetical protein
MVTCDASQWHHRFTGILFIYMISRFSPLFSFVLSSSTDCILDLPLQFLFFIIICFYYIVHYCYFKNSGWFTFHILTPFENCIHMLMNFDFSFISEFKPPQRIMEGLMLSITISTLLFVQYQQNKRFWHFYFLFFFIFFCIFFIIIVYLLQSSIYIFMFSSGFRSLTSSVGISMGWPFSLCNQSRQWLLQRSDQIARCNRFVDTSFVKKFIGAS